MERDGGGGAQAPAQTKSRMVIVQASRHATYTGQPVSIQSVETLNKLAKLLDGEKLRLLPAGGIRLGVAY